VKRPITAARLCRKDPVMNTLESELLSVCDGINWGQVYLFERWRLLCAEQ